MKIHRNRRRGFTLVEIMIVVGIIGMIAAIGFPNYVRYRNASRRGVCIANLQQLNNAKVQWAFEQKKTLTDTPVLTDLVGSTNYVRDLPACPGGGADYLTTIGTVAEKAACSLAFSDGHTL